MNWKFEVSNHCFCLESKTAGDGWSSNILSSLGSLLLCFGDFGWWNLVPVESSCWCWPKWLAIASYLAHLLLSSDHLDLGKPTLRFLEEALHCESFVLSCEAEVHAFGSWVGWYLVEDLQWLFVHIYWRIRRVHHGLKLGLSYFEVQGNQEFEICLATYCKTRRHKFYSPLHTSIFHTFSTFRLWFSFQPRHLGTTAHLVYLIL